MPGRKQRSDCSREKMWKREDGGERRRGDAWGHKFSTAYTACALRTLLRNALDCLSPPDGWGDLQGNMVLPSQVQMFPSLKKTQVKVAFLTAFLTTSDGNKPSCGCHGIPASSEHSTLSCFLCFSGLEAQGESGQHGRILGRARHAGILIETGLCCCPTPLLRIHCISSPVCLL